MTNPPATDGFEELIEFIRRDRGFDFTGYKRSSLMRRTIKRMRDVRIDSFPAYLEYLRTQPEEFVALFNTILINVTSFFRDGETWDYLAEHVVPELLERRGEEQPVRVWSAGCATGQEAFSIGMLFAQAVGDEELARRVKIYATDIDEEALAVARHAAFAGKAMESVPEPLVDRFFDHSGQRYTVARPLRRAVIFGRHNLAVDAPISRVDLMLCRNTMMYFSAPLQGAILDRIHYAMDPEGFLCLGKSEVMLTRSGHFEPVDLRRRIFRPVGPRARYHAFRHMPEDAQNQPSARASIPALVAHVLDAGDVAQVVLDQHRRVVVINERARHLFGLSAASRGKPIQDLELSYRPAELRSLIEQAEHDSRPATVSGVEWAPASGGRVFLDVTVAPLLSDTGERMGTAITFADVSRYHSMETDLRRAQREVETAYEELQSTVEELETTNEELQSTNEELETTNEELQSSNEELETMNEELQSTNEELETINDELRQRSTELNDVNFFFESVLLSMEAGVVVTDSELRVTIWNREAENLWGMRSEEVVGQHLLNLDIGLPVEQLRDPVRACLTGGSEREVLDLPATNRRGRAITCRVSCVPLPREDSIHGVVLLMEQLSGPAPELDG